MKLLTTALLLGAALLGAAPAFASSHREAPLICGPPKLDGCDFYMFNSYEAGRSNFVTFVADYLPLQDPYGGPNYFTLETNGVYEISIDNNGDAQEDITFQFQFYTSYQNIALPIGPAGNQVTNAIPLVIAGQIFPGNNAALNLTETYTVKMITGPRRTGAAQRARAPGRARPARRVRAHVAGLEPGRPRSIAPGAVSVDDPPAE